MLALMEEMEADEEVDWDALAIKVWWVCVGGGCQAAALPCHSAHRAMHSSSLLIA